MVIFSFGVGILAGFLFFELSGITAGGIIVPGYLALFIYEPLRILVTLIIGFAAYGVVLFLARFTIIFGRRRFFMMILTGFVLRYLFDSLHIYLSEPGITLQAIGYIIPGLIANEFYRQGVWKTIMAIIVVVTFTYLVLTIFYPVNI